MDVANALGETLVDALWNQQHVGVGVCDANGQLQEFNPALEEMIGPALTRSCSTEWVGQYHLFDTAGRRPLRHDDLPLARALAGEAISDAQFTTRAPGEPVRHFRCTAAPLTRDSHVTGAIMLITEVAEHGHDLAATIDAQVARYRRRLAGLQQLSARVARIANHQMRTPLTVIQAHLELLEDDLDHPDTARRNLPAIRRGLTSLNCALTALSTANDLAQATDPDLQAVDLLEIARRAVVVARAAHPGHHLHVHDHDADHLPATGDAQWVRRALVALIEAMLHPTEATEISLTAIDFHDAVGVRLTRPGHDDPTLEDPIRDWASRADFTTDPRCLGLVLAEAVALAHDGGIDIRHTPASASVTFLISREPHPHLWKP